MRTHLARILFVERWSARDRVLLAPDTSPELVPTGTCVEQTGVRLGRGRLGRGAMQLSQLTPLPQSWEPRSLSATRHTGYLEMTGAPVFFILTISPRHNGSDAGRNIHGATIARGITGSITRAWPEKPLHRRRGSGSNERSRLACMGSAAGWADLPRRRGSLGPLGRCSTCWMRNWPLFLRRSRPGSTLRDYPSLGTRTCIWTLTSLQRRCNSSRCMGCVKAGSIAPGGRSVDVYVTTRSRGARRQSGSESPAKHCFTSGPWRSVDLLEKPGSWSYVTP